MKTALALAFAALASTPAPLAHVAYVELVVTDAQGEAWVAGSGDDCAAAFEGAVIPENWREIACVYVANPAAL